MMKKIILIGAALLVLVSSAVFAEKHADAALKQTQMAVERGKAGHGPIMLQHANEALIHAKKAAEVAKGESKTHMDAAVKSLESSIEHGKMGGAEHVEAATKAALEAEEHIKAGNQ
jgi:hypothetical protein